MLSESDSAIESSKELPSGTMFMLMLIHSQDDLDKLEERLERKERTPGLGLGQVRETTEARSGYSVDQGI